MWEIKNYALLEIPPADLTAIDLRDEAEAIGFRNVVSFRITILDDRGYVSSEHGDLLWLPEDRRAGISWNGADSLWTDARDPDDALRRYVEGDMAN